MTTDMMQKYWESPQNKWNAPNWGNNSISLKFIFSSVHHYTRSPCWCSRPCKNDIRYDRTNVLSERCHVKIQLKWEDLQQGTVPYYLFLEEDIIEKHWADNLKIDAGTAKKSGKVKKYQKKATASTLLRYFAGHYELLWKWMKTIYHIYIYTGVPMVNQTHEERINAVVLVNSFNYGT